MGILLYSTHRTINNARTYDYLYPQFTYVLKSSIFSDISCVPVGRYNCDKHVLKKKEKKGKRKK